MRYSVAEQEQIAMEDLKAFGSRLRELDTESRPRDAHWAPLLGTIFACTAISVCHWVPRVRESQSIVLRGLSSRSAFTISLATLVLTVLYGLKHIVDRKRNGAVLSTDTLTLFQLECDKKGELVGISKNGLSSMPLNSQ
ncbi:hypothetical protein KR054_012580 [Drosophila jambulina]|nr:hypothetical protein KR054_012580 [Drosophila jambulina]